MSEFIIPLDPFELAASRVEASMSKDFSFLRTDEALLCDLDNDAETLGFIDSTYFITAGRSMIIPKSFEASEPVKYSDIYGLTSEAKFRSYAKVHIGRLIGQTSVRAVCMTFTDALVLPYFMEIPDEDLLYVPVLAVRSIEQTSVA